MSRKIAHLYAEALLHGTRHDVFEVAFPDRKDRLAVGEALIEMDCAVSLGQHESVLVIQRPFDRTTVLAA